MNKIPASYGRGARLAGLIVFIDPVVADTPEGRLARLGLWVWLAAFLASAGRVLLAVA